MMVMIVKTNIHAKYKRDYAHARDDVDDGNDDESDVDNDYDGHSDDDHYAATADDDNGDD